ncbi:ATP-binding protein [Geobacter sp. SVR]|uniref:ATP-binding protein n=1 Tax=Geobacter sp. SVR TaxID=2495594 RepID=UPI00143F00B2|nr:ATP-binding protein [Geobacter sp. SVR]BCS55927.1 PAS domain-containing sensor histidine kinase [Geobacter sp. SVR]GCF84690.1 PAS domain-containing sensor histidine kinase [Geobacter sp. SVR]
MRFRTKLMLSYILFVVMVSGAYYLYFKHSLTTAMIEESRASLINQAMLARLLTEQEAQSHKPQQLAERVGNAIRARVTLIAPDGTVIGDSDVGQANLAELQNHLNRPEVQEARKTGRGSAVRYSETLRRNMLYVALASGHGYLRLALPLEYLDEATSTLHGVLGGVALLTILAALVVSYFLSNLTSRPLRDIAAAAARIGRGEPVTIDAATSDEVGELAQVLNEMASRIDSQVKSLSAEKQRLATILRGMGEGVMVASVDGTISLVNPPFRNMFGLAGDVEGQRLVEISRHPDLLAAFDDVRRTQGELVREIVLPAGGTTLLTHWVPLMISGGNQGVVAVFHDISDMKRVENMRRDFVANVSHELRTPVSVIKGYAETLLDGLMESDPQRAARFVEIIQHHSERLASLINDILTLSHLESNQAALELFPMDVGGTMAKACMLLEEAARSKGVTIINEAMQRQSRVMADQGRLEQVLINLLENAVKYTPSGGTIRLFTEDEGEFVRISVADTGIGIPFKDIPRIFERFYRVDEARSREQGGTGLGLAIVKHIVQLHGGEVSVSSEQGKGSVFSCTVRKADVP